MPKKKPKPKTSRKNVNKDEFSRYKKCFIKKIHLRVFASQVKYWEAKTKKKEKNE